MLFGGRYNVMVFNLSQNYEDRFNGVKTFATANLGNVVYGIWVFESGTFKNNGDGGRDNWAFKFGLTVKINSLRSTVLNSRFIHQSYTHIGPISAMRSAFLW